ncbi:Chromate resistance protein ChrB [uncultured Clostridium sp.]|uniref:Chromate resistance protein ChrB n=1 Tax=uncultured Clostridium sp. TaxID=59620 RepID=UPI0028F171DD|nr:Chromate resistance protein ChrB [uncultured Clostridium sp.]
MEWRTLIYQIPREPQKNRMAVWRKLKSIGALNVLQSIWVLPESGEAKIEFKKLEEQIHSINGRAINCITNIDNQSKNQNIINDFNGEREADYKELIGRCRNFIEEIRSEREKENYNYAEIEENEYELNKLNKWLRKIEKKDYFNCEMKKEVLEMLETCTELFNEFSDEIFEKNEK